MFNKAIKQEAKLRLAIAGTSGSGKTYTALSISKYLTNKRIALVDTEHGSASKYADLFDFDVMEMEPPFHPERFIKAIQEAHAAGYGVIILDSLSHAWNGTGGLLEIVDDIAARSNSKNTFAAWKQGTPIYNRLIDAIVMSDIHIIATMRSKQDYVMEADERGKMSPKKVGLAPVQREGFEYEFDIVLTMDADNNGIVTKTRCPALQNGLFRKPGKEIAETINGWLTGAPVEKKPAPQMPAVQKQSAPTPAEQREQSVNGAVVDMVEPMGKWAVDYAAQAWGISASEAASEIAKLRLGRRIAKAEFVAAINPQPEYQQPESMLSVDAPATHGLPD